MAVVRFTYDLNYRKQTPSQHFAYTLVKALEILVCGIVRHCRKPNKIFVYIFCVTSCQCTTEKILFSGSQTIIGTVTTNMYVFLPIVPVTKFVTELLLSLYAYDNR